MVIVDLWASGTVEYMQIQQEMQSTLNCQLASYEPLNYDCNKSIATLFSVCRGNYFLEMLNWEGLKMEV
jgi:hypothetical protein